MFREDKKMLFMVMFVAIVLSPLFIIAQGDLLPSGAPAPTMKTLDEIFTAAESRMPISEAVTIGRPGSYYLTQNIFVKGDSDGIIIKASNVTIDLNGYSIIGPSIGSSNGISCSGQYNIKIMNGNIANFGDDGVSCSGTSDTTVLNLCTSDNGLYGIYLGANSIVKNCISTENGSVGILAGANSIIENCISKSNKSNGFSVSGGSLVKSCTSSDNGSAGFSFTGRCQASNCVSYSNSGYGFAASISALSGRTGLVLLDSNSHSNGSDGVYAGTGSFIENCSIYANEGHGVNVSEGSVLSLGGGIDTRAAIKNCNITNNTKNGIIAFSGCDITGNNISKNNEYGIYISNFARKPTGTDYGTANRIEKNQLSYNTLKGIYIPGKGANVIISNTATKNGTTNPDDDYDVETTNNIRGTITNNAAITQPFANLYY